MFAWSPIGHRLAYSTSGFPSPHQLLVVDDPQAEPDKLFSKRDHFDWFSWSPDARQLIVDDEPEDRWLLLDSRGRTPHQSVTRFGGAPLWCCPTNEFRTAF
jgi:Tol biopolymer transport system component